MMIKIMIIMSIIKRETPKYIDEISGHPSLQEMWEIVLTCISSVFCCAFG